MNSTVNLKSKGGAGSHPKRVSTRRNINVLAALMRDEKKLICFSLVANISESGAKLILPDQIEVPDRFMLLLSSRFGPRRICSVVWRTKDEIGVRFFPTGDKPPKPSEATGGPGRAA